jgi:hypothetical protein
MGRHFPSSWLVRVGLAVLLMLLVGRAIPSPAAKRAKPVSVPITFSSIPWFTPADSALAMLASRGYREVASTGDTASMVCEGQLFERPARVQGWLDEQRRVMRWVVTLVAPERGDVYPGMRKVYDDVVAEALAKYGVRADWADRFVFPFEKGDAREADALREGEATIRSTWATPAGDRLTVEMNRACGVALTYECSGWAALQARLRGKKARDL